MSLLLSDPNGWYYQQNYKTIATIPTGDKPIYFILYSYPKCVYDLENAEVK